MSNFSGKILLLTRKELSRSMVIFIKFVIYFTSWHVKFTLNVKETDVDYALSESVMSSIKQTKYVLVNMIV